MARAMDTAALSDRPVPGLLSKLVGTTFVSFKRGDDGLEGYLLADCVCRDVFAALARARLFVDKDHIRRMHV